MSDMDGLLVPREARGSGNDSGSAWGNLVPPALAVFVGLVVGIVTGYLLNGLALVLWTWHKRRKQGEGTTSRSDHQVVRYPQS